MESNTIFRRRVGHIWVDNVCDFPWDRGIVFFIADTVERKEVMIDETMLAITSDLLASAFTGKEVDVFRAVHFCEDLQFASDV